MDDYEAITQLVARCAYAFDQRDVAGWLACWTGDGTLHRAGGGTVSGHADLAGFVSAFPGRGRHVVTNSIIEVDGDRATHRAYVQYFDRNAPHALVMLGVYDDELARQDGSWRFSRRRATSDADSTS
jgi:3-phenylpropionate/cinnamic acid dioxygenase small subunit